VPYIKPLTANVTNIANHDLALPTPLLFAFAERPAVFQAAAK
jgi:hypothetical protein